MYEFIDEDRFEVQEIYWDFLEQGGRNTKKNLKELQKMVKKDPNFFDPYIIIADYHRENNQPRDAFDIVKEGYNRAMNLVIKKGRFPDDLSWLYSENRHIIRIIFHYGMLMWEHGEKDEALRIFQQLLASNTHDNIGARYAIVALLEGIPSMRAYEEKFTTKDGNMDMDKIEIWFRRGTNKYPTQIGWWLELADEDSLGD